MPASTRQPSSVALIDQRSIHPSSEFISYHLKDPVTFFDRLTVTRFVTCPWTIKPAAPDYGPVRFSRLVAKNRRLEVFKWSQPSIQDFCPGARASAESTGCTRKTRPRTKRHRGNFQDREHHPARWTGQTRTWGPVVVVDLKPRNRMGWSTQNLCLAVKTDPRLHQRNDKDLDARAASKHGRIPRRTQNTSSLLTCGADRKCPLKNTLKKHENHDAKTLWSRAPTYRRKIFFFHVARESTIRPITHPHNRCIRNNTWHQRFST